MNKREVWRRESRVGCRASGVGYCALREYLQTKTHIKLQPARQGVVDE